MTYHRNLDRLLQQQRICSPRMRLNYANRPLDAPKTKRGGIDVRSNRFDAPLRAYQRQGASSLEEGTGIGGSYQRLAGGEPRRLSCLFVLSGDGRSNGATQGFMYDTTPTRPEVSRIIAASAGLPISFCFWQRSSYSPEYSNLKRRNPRGF